MKPIRYRKIQHPGGFLSYYRDTSIDDGRLYRSVLHLSPQEVEQGRSYIAMKLRRWHRNIRRNLEEHLACIRSARSATKG